MNVFIFTSLIGIFILAYAIKNIYKIKKFNKVTATIIGYKYDPNRKGKKTSYPVVQYEVDNSVYKALLKYKRSGYGFGSKITIYYNPNNYEEVDSLESYGFVIIVGIVFLMLPVLSKL